MTTTGPSLAGRAEAARRAMGPTLRHIAGDDVKLARIQWYAYLVGAEARLRLCGMLGCLYTMPGSPFEGGAACPEREKIGAETDAGEEVIADFTREMWCPNCQVVGLTHDEIGQALLLERVPGGPGA